MNRSYHELASAFAEPEKEDLRREHLRLFSLTVSGGISPYETEYGREEIFQKTQRLADIAGFYRAFGLEIRDGSRVDFISAELDFMHWLQVKEGYARQKGEKEHAEICREAARKFLNDHLGRWALFFGQKIVETAEHPFFREAGEKLVRFIEEECRRLGAEPERLTERQPVIPEQEFTCEGGTGVCLT